jgi:hypothetical protein
MPIGDGDLYSLVKTCNHISQDLVDHVMLDCLQGMRALDSQGIIYGNTSMGNILFTVGPDGTPTFQLSEFGVSGVGVWQVRNLKSTKFNPPETFRNNTNPRATDPMKVGIASLFYAIAEMLSLAVDIESVEDWRFLRSSAREDGRLDSYMDMSRTDPNKRLSAAEMLSRFHNNRPKGYNS